MRNCIKSTVFAAVFAVAGIAAFGGASAGSARSGCACTSIRSASAFALNVGASKCRCFWYNSPWRKS